MRIVDKPWGREKIWAETDKYVGKFLRIDAGQKLSRQYHVVKEETIYVLEGTLYLEIGAGAEITTHVLYSGDSFHINPGTVHRFCASSLDAVKLVEVSTPQLDDIVRLEDIYDRVEKV